jgi:hypothetical protein
MNGYASAYDLGDLPASPPAQARQAIAPAITERHALCGECFQVVFMDTDGMGGLVSLNPGTYTRHCHG